jgi:hypothetical protein
MARRIGVAQPPFCWRIVGRRPAEEAGTSRPQRLRRTLQEYCGMLQNLSSMARQWPHFLYFCSSNISIPTPRRTSALVWIIGGQEFDDAEPLLLILAVQFDIVFVLRSQARQITFSGALVQNSQYTDDTQRAGSFVLPTDICRALRCDRCLVIAT